ncbi:MAG: HlyD family efflux transporter periplasmic adaptor subunit [Candidatus Levybacteria bacterium]|nr:HlyD family efflux transporter periplasmic adaptor subunit [Candidatus Levybacteria bacterium]
MYKQYRSYALAAIARGRSRLRRIRERIPYRQTVIFLRRRPFASFFTALGVLLALIIAGNVLRTLSRPVQEKPELVKSVQTYKVDTSPSVQVQGKVEKEGVVTILAQTAGIVDSVSVKEGDSVRKGTSIVSLSSNYQGANAPAIQAQIAQQQYQNVLDTYASQKDILQFQKDLATVGRENTEQLRQIAERSIGDTQEILRFNETMHTLVNQAIGNTPSDPQDSQFANPLQQTRGQLLASVVQVRSQLRTLEQQVDTNRAPAQLANLQRDVTLKQLNIQEKALDLQKETARLQAALAAINASLMRPASPFDGVVQRIFVRPGQTVAPGTPLAIVSQSDHAISVVATLPYEIAKGVTTSSESQLTIRKKTVSLRPVHVSTDATDGQLYSIRYQLPVDFEKDVTDKESILISLPVSYADTTQTVPFVPLDSVYQTQEAAFIYTAENGKAVAKEITLGEVFGRFVSVTSGLAFGDEVILSRNVVENDRIKSL